jgi:hypothetical protein
LATDNLSNNIDEECNKTKQINILKRKSKISVCHFQSEYLKHWDLRIQDPEEGSTK